MVGDVLRDAHMQSRCVTQLTIVTFRPQVRIAGSMDELDSDPSPLAGDHDTSFDERINAQLSRAVRQRFTSPLKAHDRGSRNDLEPSHVREMIYQFIAHAVSPIL